MINIISVVLAYMLPNGLGSWPTVCSKCISLKYCNKPIHPFKPTIRLEYCIRKKKKKSIPLRCNAKMCFLIPSCMQQDIKNTTHTK